MLRIPKWYDTSKSDHRCQNGTILNFRYPFSKRCPTFSGIAKFFGFCLLDATQISKIWHVIHRWKATFKAFQMSPFAGLYSQGDERKCRSSEPPIFKKWVEKNPDFTYGSGFFKISLEPHVAQKSTLYPQKLDKIIFPMVCDTALYV